MSFFSFFVFQRTILSSSTPHARPPARQIIFYCRLDSKVLGSPTTSESKAIQKYEKDTLFGRLGIQHTKIIPLSKVCLQKLIESTLTSLLPPPTPSLPTPLPPTPPHPLLPSPDQPQTSILENNSTLFLFLLLLLRNVPYPLTNNNNNNNTHDYAATLDATLVRRGWRRFAAGAGRIPKVTAPARHIPHTTIAFCCCRFPQRHTARNATPFTLLSRNRRPPSKSSRSSTHSISSNIRGRRRKFDTGQ